MSSSCAWCKLFEIRRLIFHIGNPTIAERFRVCGQHNHAVGVRTVGVKFIANNTEIIRISASKFGFVYQTSTPFLVSSPDQIFRARPADSSKNRVWTLHCKNWGKFIPYSGKFSRAQIFANHQQTRQEKNFAIFIFAIRSRYLTTPPTISRMEMVTLSVYFNVKTTVRR